MQLFWGEPLDGVAARIDRLRALSAEVGRDLPPLEYGLRITTLVRDTTEEAWADAEAKVIGINTAVAASNGQLQASNIGFVIPIADAVAIADAVI